MGYATVSASRNHRHSSHYPTGDFQVLNLTTDILGIPEKYLVGIVPASDSGAVEMALWSMLGPKTVDVFYRESFGLGWFVDIEKQLNLPNTHAFSADYGKLPDLKQADFSHDVVFAWNGCMKK